VASEDEKAMSHKRQLIRDRVAQILRGLDTTRVNVFTSRNYRLSDDELPAIKVYTGSEELVEDSFSKGFSALIQVELSIEITLKKNDFYDDWLDDSLSEIQAAMTLERSSDLPDSLPSITNIFYYSGLDDVEYIDGETDIGLQKINYTVQYEQVI
jgi:hypothetical protein